MPPGTPYHSFALPYPIRVDNFTDTLDDLPPPYNRPPLHLLTHTHSDHILGLASKSFAYRVICSPDAKEMLLRHETYAERALHDHAYRAEKKKTFRHLKVEPYLMPNGQRFFTGSRDLLLAVPLNTPTEFDISDTETVTITLIDANHCPGSVMFLIEGPRGSVLHTGDFRAEPWFLSSIQRNHFLQPYLSGTPEDLRIFVARKDDTHAEATGLVKTLEAIYLDTACLLSSTVVPSKERAVKGIVELVALFPPSTYFFVNAWTWGYEDVLKGIARAFHCKIHFDRYKHSIYSHSSDPLLRILGTRDAASTRFHACERFDRCSFADVPPCEHETKSTMAPVSKEGKKVVYVNAVNMSCARWEDYQADVKRRVSRGENVDSLLVPLSRHSPLPELMNFVTLFRPLRVVPNTLDPLLNGLDWGAMSKMFSGCLAPASASGSLASVMAPTCPLTQHSSVISLPGPSINYNQRTFPSADEEQYVDTAYSNLVGPSDPAEQWGENGARKARMDILNAWISVGRRKGLWPIHWRVGEDENQDGRPDMDAGDHARVAGPSRLGSSSGMVPRRRTARSDDDSDHSSDEGGSDEHARTAREIFGVGEPSDVHKTWTSPSSRSQSQARGEEAVFDTEMLPTPTSSPLLREIELMTNEKGDGYSIESPSPTTPDQTSRLTLASPCASLFVSFDDIGSPGSSLGQRTNEAAGSGSQPFTCLDNVVLPILSEGAMHTNLSTQCRNQSQQASPVSERNSLLIRDVEDLQTRSVVDVENNSDRRRSKRRRIDREESGMKTAKEADMPELTGGKGDYMTPCGRDKTCEPPPKSHIRLTHAPTAPCIASRDDNDTSRHLTPSTLAAESALGGTLAPTVAGAASIPFPVRKRIQGRTKGVGKAASFCGPGLTIPSRGGNVPYATSVTVHTSADLRTESHSTTTISTTVSPRTAARRAQRAERRRTTEKLQRARPDLAVRTQSSRDSEGSDERAWTGGGSGTRCQNGLGEESIASGEGARSP